MAMVMFALSVIVYAMLTVEIGITKLDLRNGPRSNVDIPIESRLAIFCADT